jgi:hypothetical protein
MRTLIVLHLITRRKFRGMASVVDYIYSMVAFGGKRSEDSEKTIKEIRNRVVLVSNG